MDYVFIDRDTKLEVLVAELAPMEARFLLGRLRRAHDIERMGQLQDEFLWLLNGHIDHHFWRNKLATDIHKRRKSLNMAEAYGVSTQEVPSGNSTDC